MNKKIIFILVFYLFCTGLFSQNITPSMNPFFTPYTTPFNVPPFDLIKNEHYKPALLEGMKQHSAEIELIANATAQPTFENTIVALENAGELLSKVNVVFSNMNGANTNEELQKIAKEIAPLQSAHFDNIYLNQKLFERVKKIWDQRLSLELTSEELVLLEKKYKSFVRSGANLTASQKERLRAINADLSVLTLKYGQNILSETNSFEMLLTNIDELKGLPTELIEGAAADAKAKGKSGWLFTLSNSSVMPFLQYASNRNLRFKIWDAYQTRANHDDDYDNKANVLSISNLRNERAVLLGYESHAHYTLEETMAKNPQNAYKLLNDLWEPALAMAKIEAKDIEKLMRKDGIESALEPYDWRYYTEKIRKERFDLDEQELKPYFSIDNVRKGIFMVCNNLYGIQFKQLSNLPVYHEDVTAWQVTEANGNHIGVMYMDFHPRKSKRGGAWMTSYINQKTKDGIRVAPVVSIVCNFSKPTQNAPALLTFDEVTTFFHEFGHALHGLFSNVTYRSLSGTSVPRDFVELPSQIMENWASEPEVLKMYAKHYKTGETIPASLIEKMQKAGTFDQGFATVEYLAASFLDLDYHSQKQSITTDVNTFEKESMHKIGLINAIIPRYRSTYFNHIFAGGYSAGYYSYIWSGVLDTDAFDAFKSTQLFNKEKAASFRKNILEKGGTDDPMKMYKAFRGAEPSVLPLLKKRGLDVKPVMNP